MNEKIRQVIEIIKHLRQRIVDSKRYIYPLPGVVESELKKALALLESAEAEKATEANDKCQCAGCRLDLRLEYLADRYSFHDLDRRFLLNDVFGWIKHLQAEIKQLEKELKIEKDG